MEKIIDISLPIHNNMWAYRPELENSVSLFQSTLKGDQSTVYKLNLYSNTGTYIETSQHKLPNELILNDRSLNSFYREVKVIITDEQEIITKKRTLEIAEKHNITLQKGDALIIANGYGVNHKNEKYLEDSPSFEIELTNCLADLKLDLLGVDTPIIENLKQPYQPVTKLFKANEELLLLAPLLIDLTTVKTGNYTLCCFPLNVEATAVMLCRPVLIQK